MSNELVTQPKLKAAIDGGASYAEIVKQVKAEAVPNETKRKANLAARKKALQLAVKNSDRKVLAQLRKAMRTYVSNMAEIVMDTPRELTVEEARDLMAEDQKLREIDDFLKARRDTHKELVFTAIDEQLRARGIDDPENQNGEIVVPELGKKFKREGAGFKDATLDLKALEALLGEDAKKVFKERIVPATVVKDVDEEALGKLILEDPKVLEKVRSVLIPGGLKPARFVVRDMTEE